MVIEKMKDAKRGGKIKGNKITREEMTGEEGGRQDKTKGNTMKGDKGAMRNNFSMYVVLRYILL